MIKLTCLTVPFARYSLERALAGIASAGFRYVGLGWPNEGKDPLGLDAADTRVTQARTLCDHYGLTPAVIGRGPITVTERAEGLKRRIDVTKALGAELIQMAGISSHKRFPDEPTAPEAFRAEHQRFVSDLKTAGDYAHQQGIRIALKPHSGNTATAKHLTDLLLEIDSLGVVAGYDPGNVHFYEGMSPEEDFPTIAPQTCEIIAKDHKGPRATLNFPILGDGDIDWQNIFTTAYKAAFRGPVVVERVDATGGPPSSDELDRRIKCARERLITLLSGIGFDVQ